MGTSHVVVVDDDYVVGLPPLSHGTSQQDTVTPGRDTLTFSQLQRVAERLHSLGPAEVSATDANWRSRLVSEVLDAHEAHASPCSSHFPKAGQPLSWVGRPRWVGKRAELGGGDLVGSGVTDVADGRYPGVPVSAAGFVVQVRKAGRKLLFLDVVEESRSGAPTLELIVKTPTLQEEEVLEIKRMVSRKDLVLASGWLEVVKPKGSGGQAARVIMLHVEAMAMLRNHTVWVTGDMPSEERQLELALDGLIAETHIRKNLLAISCSGSDAQQCSMWGLCPTWAETGECVLHASGKCKWRHEYADEGERGRREWLLKRAREMREREQDPDDPYEHDDDDDDDDDKGEDGDSGIDISTMDPASRARNAEGGMASRLWPRATTKYSACMRAEIFVEWLVTRFGGVSVLGTGSGVLDVAGGRGAVAFELSVVRGVPCTVVDPRPIKYNRRQASAVRRLQQANTHSGISDVALGDDNATDAGLKSSIVVDNECSMPSSNGSAESSAALKRKLGELHHKEEHAGTVVRPSLPGHHQETFDDSWLAAHAARLADVSCLVGMHPDQATEAIVDVALALRKPFAVLPCCVFPRLFSQRRSVSGELVVSYRQFIDYLLAKDGRIRLEYLPFSGRNKVLYLPPE